MMGLVTNLAWTKSSAFIQDDSYGLLTQYPIFLSKKNKPNYFYPFFWPALFFIWFGFCFNLQEYLCAGLWWFWDSLYHLTSLSQSHGCCQKSQTWGRDQAYHGDHVTLSCTGSCWCDEDCLLYAISNKCVKQVRPSKPRIIWSLNRLLAVYTILMGKKRCFISYNFCLPPNPVNPTRIFAALTSLKI